MINHEQNMSKEKEYFAFISYQRDDEEWAKWLAHELEHYHLPLTLNGREDLPQNLRPIFRDIDELSAGNLPRQINQALRSSKYLIVICSPRSAKSPWVNKEIQEFINLGKTDKIFPFIVDGIAMCKNPEDPKECFPPALRNLPKDEERLGANINENGHGINKLRTCDDCPIKGKKKNLGDINEKGRDAAVVKIVAGMLGLSFDSLWMRYEQEKVEEERKIKEQRDNLLKMQSKYLSEKVLQLATEGDVYSARRLALEILPQNIDYPERPYVPEAEFAIRETLKCKDMIIWQEHEEEKRIENFAIHPDSQSIAIAIGSQILLVNSKNGLENYTLSGHSDIVTSLSFSPDGKFLLSASEDRMLRIWDMSTRQCVNVLEGHKRMVQHVAWSPQNNILASASWDNTIRIWNAYTGKCVHILNHHNRNVLYVSFNIQGNRLVSSSNDHSICVWNVDNGVLLSTLDGHNDSVNAVVFSDNGKLIASVSDDHTIRIWDSESGMCIKTIQLHSQIRRLLFAPDNNFLIFPYGRTICLWDIEKAICTKFIGEHKGDVIDLLPFNNFKYVMSSSTDGTIRIWSLEQELCGRTYGGNKNCTNAIVYSPDYKSIVTGTDNYVRVWDVDTEELEQEFYVSGRVEKCIYNSLRNYIMSYSEYDLEYSISIYDIHLKKIIKSVDGKFPQLLKNGDSFIYLGTKEGSDTIYLQSICDKEPTKLFVNDTGYVTQLSINDSETMIALGTYSGVIKVWDIKSRECIHLFKKNNHIVNDLTFDSKENVIAAASGSEISVWDLNKGELVVAFEHSEGAICTKIAFNPDNSIIMSLYNNGDLFLWNINSNNVVKCKGHTKTINSISISPDGQRILTASSDKTIRLWDVLSGGCLKILENHSDLDNIAIFNKDCSRIISASQNDVVLVWDTRTFKVLTAIEKVDKIAVRPNSHDMVAISPRSIKIRNIASGEIVLFLYESEGTISDFVFDPSGLFILTSAFRYEKATSLRDKNINSFSFVSIIRLVNVNNGECIWHSCIGGLINAIAISSNAKFILFSRENNNISIWDRVAGVYKKDLIGHTDIIKTIAIDHSEKFVVSSSQDGTIRIWDFCSGKCLYVLENACNKNTANSLIMHPTRPLIAFITSSYEYRVWNILTREYMLLRDDGIVEKSRLGANANFSIDGRFLLVTYNSSKKSFIRLFDLDSEKLIKSIVVGGICVSNKYSVPFNKDMQILVRCPDGIFLYDLNSGMRSAEVSKDKNFTASFSPCESYIICHGVSTYSIYEYSSLRDILQKTRDQLQDTTIPQELRDKYYII